MKDAAWLAAGSAVAEIARQRNEELFSHPNIRLSGRPLKAPAGCHAALKGDMEQSQCQRLIGRSDGGMAAL